MQKIVINTCFGGFGLSKEAYNYMGLEWDNYGYFDGSRTDPDLIDAVKDLGEKVNGAYASLKIVEIPNDVEWEICEYDGREWVAEKHRSWS